MSEYRVEVYDLNIKDAWQREITSGQANPNFTQSLFDWASRTLVVAVADSQSAFWIQRVESRHVNNNQRITLGDTTGTNIILLIYKEQRRKIQLSWRLQLSDYLKQNSTYLKFLEQKEIAKQTIQQWKNELNLQYNNELNQQLKGVVDGLAAEFGALAVQVTSIDDQIRNASIPCSATYELNLVLNPQIMTEWLNKNQIGTNKWNQTNNLLLQDEKRVLARILHMAIQYNESQVVSALTGLESFSSIWREVGMPYDVIGLIHLPSDDLQKIDDIRNNIAIIESKIQVECQIASDNIAEKLKKAIGQRNKIKEDYREGGINIKMKLMEMYIEYCRSIAPLKPMSFEEWLKGFSHVLPGTQPDILPASNQHPELQNPSQSLPHEVIPQSPAPARALCPDCNGERHLKNRACVRCDGRGYVNLR